MKIKFEMRHDIASNTYRVYRVNFLDRLSGERGEYIASGVTKEEALEKAKWQLRPFSIRRPVVLRGKL